MLRWSKVEILGVNIITNRFFGCHIRLSTYKTLIWQHWSVLYLCLNCKGNKNKLQIALYQVFMLLYTRLQCGVSFHLNILFIIL